MADVLTNRNVLTIGKFVGPSSYLTRVDNVNVSGGTVALNATTSWNNFPDEKEWKWKPIYEKNEIRNKTGGFSVKTGSLIGGQYSTVFNQRDTASIEFFLKFMGYECVLLTQGHIFDRVGAKIKRQWLAVFCTAEPLEGEINGENGEVPFVVSALYNLNPIVLGTGGIAYPTGPTAPTGIPNGVMTIPAGGYYKMMDIEDT